MTKKQSQAQGEIQLLSEWLNTLPATYLSTTRMKVGKQTLFYAGVPLTPAQSAAFGVWSDWCDARVVTPSEVWIVEAKIVGLGTAYGQVLDYCQQYPQSLDYQSYAPKPIVPVVLCYSSRPRTAAYFATLGVRTIVYTPSFSFTDALGKIFPAAQVLQS